MNVERTTVTRPVVSVESVETVTITLTVAEARDLRFALSQAGDWQRAARALWRPANWAQLQALCSELPTPALA